MKIGRKSVEIFSSPKIRHLRHILLLVSFGDGNIKDWGVPKGSEAFELLSVSGPLGSKYLARGV